MSQVTIKATQSHLFTAGEVVRVERTPFIERLIANEQVVVVDDDTLAPEVDLSASINPELLVPQRNASTDDWSAFVRTHVPADRVATLGEHPTRAELIAVWDEFAEGDAPSGQQETVNGVPAAPDNVLAEGVAAQGTDADPA